MTLKTSTMFRICRIGAALLLPGSCSMSPSVRADEKIPMSVKPAASRPMAARRRIVGRDDAVICCGPGTDEGMDSSPTAIERIVMRRKARGLKGSLLAHR